MSVLSTAHQVFQLTQIPEVQVLLVGQILVRDNIRVAVLVTLGEFLVPLFVGDGKGKTQY